jgi:hypothetical protein
LREAKMKQMLGVLMLLALCGSAAHAQNPWYWEILPSEPTALDTVKISTAFYSDYNLSFESSHTVNDTAISVNVDVFTGMLPISGWFFHTEEIGRLAAGSYSCRIYVDYYVWNMGGWWDWVGSAHGGGGFEVRAVGDLNGDALIDVADIVFLVDYLYRNGEAPDPVEIADVNCSGVVNVGDLVYLVGYLYKGGPAPDC